MQAAFDRSAEDVGNVVALEHVNVRIPDQQIATVFYVTGLGLTRDPYIMTGIDNMWINVGRSQFHLPVGKWNWLRPNRHRAARPGSAVAAAGARPTAARRHLV